VSFHTQAYSLIEQFQTSSNPNLLKTHPAQPTYTKSPATKPKNQMNYDLSTLPFSAFLQKTLGL